MSYSPTTDFLALLRQTSGGMRAETVPGLDYVVSALARAGFFSLSIGQTAPVANQSTTAWFRPASPSWTSEGVLYLWSTATATYEVATPALWGAIIASANASVVQDVTVAGPVPVQAGARVVRVMNVGAPVTLTMPLAANMSNDVLISDWVNLAGTNPITINRTAPDVFPNGLTTLVIAGDGGSFFLRPVPGGYAL